MSEWSLFIAVFLACSVEAVEATTIVLAVGTARDWRSALFGAAAGVAVLAVIIGVAGPAIQLVPIGGLRLVVGGLLLVFGLQWIRKAVLRSSGYKALHDEEAIFHSAVATASSADAGSRPGVSDWYAFTLSFKGVVLEGLEVAFIVLTFGTIQHRVGLASLAAAIAIIVIATAGFAVRKPLARVPENTMKFVVGIMLTSFGIFWGTEGAGATWPGADIALLLLVPFVAVISLGLVVVLRARRRAVAQPIPARVAVPERVALEQVALEQVASAEPDAPSDARRRTFRHRLGAFGAFWYDFIVGDDWQVTVGIVVAFALTFVLALAGVSSWWLVPVIVLLLLPYSIARVIRAR